MFAIAGIIFIIFAIAYAFLTAAVFYHLHQFTLPGWNVPKIVVPIFILLSVIFFSLAAYFFFVTPWNQL